MISNPSDGWGSRAERLLSAVQPYAEDDPVLPPLGCAADFRGTMRRTPEAWLREHGGVEAPDVEARIDRDPHPLPDDANREGYSAGYHLPYWLSGLADYLKTEAAVAPYGCVGGRMYEFGGGTGRVFRHFALQSERWEVWSSDFRLSSVEWNLRHLPVGMKTFANSSTPSLPLPDAAFDLVTAFSVFTHINQSETTWLLELRRILKPGGLAYLTVHDERTWLADARLRSEFTRSLGLPPDASMPAGKTVSVWREDDPYNCNVLHAADHLARVWGRFFDILEVRSLWVGAQAAVICRRPD